MCLHFLIYKKKKKKEKLSRSCLQETDVQGNGIYITATGWGWRIRKRDELLAWFTWLHSPKEKTLVEKMGADDP